MAGARLYGVVDELLCSFSGAPPARIGARGGKATSISGLCINSCNAGTRSPRLETPAMSFNASAKRVRDRHQPVARRVSCLCECLERFSPFGFQTTRQRLRFVVGAAESGWTEDQLVGALEILETARASWKRHLERESAWRRELKRRDRSVRRQTDGEMLRCARATSRATGDLACGRLGDCERCGHRLIHHGGYACSAWDRST